MLTDTNPAPNGGSGLSRSPPTTTVYVDVRRRLSDVTIGGGLSPVARTRTPCLPPCRFYGPTQGFDGGMATQVKFTPEMLRRLKGAYDKAVASKSEVFVFDGKSVVGYAKYLIEYLEG